MSMHASLPWRSRCPSQRCVAVTRLTSSPCPATTSPRHRSWQVFLNARETFITELTRTTARVRCLTAARAGRGRKREAKRAREWPPTPRPMKKMGSVSSGAGRMWSGGLGTDASLRDGTGNGGRERRGGGCVCESVRKVWRGAVAAGRPRREGSRHTGEGAAWVRTRTCRCCAGRGLDRGLGEELDRG